MERYILKFLQDHSDNDLLNKYVDYLKVDLDGFFYAYGDNMNVNYPSPRAINLSCYLNFTRRLVRCEKAHAGKDANGILNFVPFPETVSRQFCCDLIGSIAQPVGRKLVVSKELIDFYWFYSKLVKKKDFNVILTIDNCEKLESFKHCLTEEYSKYNFKALFVGNGEPFMFKMHLDIAKELHIPSFIFLHGIPGIYNLDTEKKADYLLVWGDKIKQNYIDAGFDSNRIIVSGHPRFSSILPISSLRNDFSNVLVTTTASVMWSPHGWQASKFPIYDRSIIVLYCYSVQSTLQKFGVKKARLRVHPSVNKEWIMKFVDKGFYTIDYLSLADSLRESSLVVGPTSTVWLESLMAGVNYMVYEPLYDGTQRQLVPPFDGSDSLLKVAEDEEQLTELFHNMYQPDMEIVSKYVKPWDSELVNKLLN